MSATPAIARSVVFIASCVVTTLLGACGAATPADRVLATLEDTNAASAADPAAVDAYAPLVCQILRDTPSFTIEQTSRFIASAPPGTYPQLPLQGLTDAELTELNRAVASEYCPEAL